MRTIIEGVARRIEERKYQSAQDAIEGMRLAYADRLRAHELIEADKRIHISYQTLRTTVETFSELNQSVINKLERATDPRSETNLILGNAILIFEITDFLIGYLQRFNVDGVTDIQRLHEETKKKTEELRQQQRDLERLASAPSIDETVREQTLNDIRNRESSIGLLEREWAQYILSIQSLEEECGTLRGKIPTLELIRENARVQINLIQAVAMLQILKQNVGTIQATIVTLENMKLVTLSTWRVRRLLGVA
jgi:cell division protein FtsB